jgi:N-acetylglucosaminyldiphosphoundecaprenol N-acetyl-beta-D-mannosaminyltransferase
MPERTSFLNVPLDIVAPDELSYTILEMLKTHKTGNIVLLSVWDLLRVRRNVEYRAFVEGASLVIPISRSIISGCRFLQGKKNPPENLPVRYMPFRFIVDVLSLLEGGNFTVYLLGSSRKNLEKTERNILSTFPGLRIVGRHPGRIRKQEQNALVETIRKTTPSFLLVNKGVRGGEKWLVRHWGSLNPGFRLWCSDCFEVFADKAYRPSEKTFERGLEWFHYCCQKPYKFLRVVLFIYYKLLLLYWKLFKVGKETV